MTPRRLEEFFRKHRSAAAIGLLFPSAVFCCAIASAAELKPRVFGRNHAVGAETAALVRIVDGTLTTWFPVVGALLRLDGGRLITSCTGTLISCDAFLTAAHCVAGDTDKAHYKVFLQHGGLFDVHSLDWPKRDYRPPSVQSGSHADVAVLRLANPVEGIAPLAINADAEQAVGAKPQIVGFGRTSQQNANTGLKRFGDVVTSQCPDPYAKSDLICWRYAPGDGADTCYGDSGGPLMTSQNRPMPVVSGVTSGGADLTCVKGDRAYDASVLQNSDWIRKAANLDAPQAQCGALPPLEQSNEDHSRYEPFTGQINAKFPEQVFQVSVENTTRMRVSANLARPAGMTDDNFVKQPQLYVVQGINRNTDQALCQTKPKAQVAFCEMKPPADGVYTIILRGDNPKAIADFQLVVSVF